MQAEKVAVVGASGYSGEELLRLLVRHLQEEEARELLDIVAVGEAVVSENVAVVPQLLDDLLGVVRQGDSYAAGARAGCSGATRRPSKAERT